MIPCEVSQEGKVEKIKICPKCNEEKELSKFQLNEDGSIRRHVCKACYGKQTRAKIKLEVLNAYGNKCICCGEIHPCFLELDHVNNDGAKQKRELNLNEQQVYYLAKKEGYPKDKYQLLCANCNKAKEYYGICPHQSGVTAEQMIDILEDKLFRFGKENQNNKRNKGLVLGPQTQKQQALERNKGFSSRREMLRTKKRQAKKEDKLKTILQEFLDKGIKPEDIIKALD